ncbi:hypothetical protein BGZ94_000563 [Podila epigama]|nr:hypothetical protein BGZ94_000563 [Podila epigama]
MVLSLLASCMGFHIWFVIVRKSTKTELQMLKWYCLIAFSIPLIATSIALILLRNQPFFSSYPRRFFCDFKESFVTLGTFVIPLTIGALPGIVLTRFAPYPVAHLLSMSTPSVSPATDRLAQ